MLESVIISTLAGSLVCIMVLIFKNKILSLLGGKALYYISLLTMLIFVLPMNIGEITLPEIQIQREVNITEFNTTTPINNTNNAQPKNQKQQVYDKPQYNTLPKPSNIVRRSNPVTIQEILFVVWLLGFIVSMLRYFISYFRFKKKICNFDTHEKINGVDVIKSPLITSPMIFGFFKPTLAIPEIEMNEEDYNLAIKHEMVHYKHHDSWFKLFAVMVNSICWFNPIAYFMVNLIGEACEYACDEQVTKEMDIEDKKQYSTMILSMVCQSSPALSSNMAKNKKQLKRRFEMIMKKKRFSIFKTAFCTLLILAVTCGSVVLANEVAPIVSSLLKDDYVYITNFGKGNYNGFVPTEKDGVYYLPWREFLNNSDVENDKIKYDNGTVTVDVWSKTHKMITALEPNTSGEPTVRSETTIPGRLVWATSCKIGEKDVFIDGNKFSLTNPPYIDNGITYVPYEYIQILKNYEETSIEKSEDFSHRTTVFSGTMKFGYDSMKSKFYADDLEIVSLTRKKLDSDVAGNTLVSISGYACEQADAYIRKTGYRTEFEAKFSFRNYANRNDAGNAEVILNKVTRIYSKGSDIEGQFTVKIDGKTIYENEKGYITNLPIPAGDGKVDTGETTILVGDTTIRVFFMGFGERPYEEYSALSLKNREISKMYDTKRIGLFPVETKLNGKEVKRTNKDNYFEYNINENYALIGIGFDDYINEQNMKYGDYNSYSITRDEESQIRMIDENTFAGHFYFEHSTTRIDSFDAIITLLPDNKFEFRSNDGKYIVRGTTGEFIPQWEWSEEQKMSYPPQVVMIDE